ncbi:hopanoid biosynthesis-associated protein HpnK [Gloeocapsa sp. PCC 73106]|uniref:hopanoid biosynthesis-associated protein HpnK n=1 Tax=Gloeocapsa sp. PCC 73106 TaxID=102232 RepID=UPI0002ABE2BD|nr:hopanoid biosynthesis-associated protein HpnK [Gloeocapsa sp. PCC 73106]ELR98269.1 hopanoid biosynthesis associated protein HpnK [Gloeocapsa sp. PCC 73106]
MAILTGRKLIINGDDFGLNDRVNQAIIQAHTEGILTSTSLMVTAEAFPQAVALAKTHPQLGVGLHLVLVCGKSVLSPQAIPHLVDSRGFFANNPLLAGLNYQFSRTAREELKAEISAQLTKFRQTGLKLSHVDGHLHLHLHPVILSILVELAPEYQIKFIRLPAEELNLTLTTNPVSQLLTFFVFSLLHRWGKNLLDTHNISYTERVYGLLATGKVTEDYLLKIIPKIQGNLVEIYNHPDETGSGKLEKNALISLNVKKELTTYGLNLTNFIKIYGELINR